MPAMTVIEAKKPVDSSKLYGEFLSEYPGYNSWVTLTGGTFYLAPETPDIDSVAKRIPELIEVHDPTPVEPLPAPAAMLRAILQDVEDFDDVTKSILDAMLQMLGG